uniref:Amidase n=1 Tax=Eiseniibacteriota bacterium TaxID=2212470 RepID=A0A832MKY7_UNCEI
MVGEEVLHLTVAELSARIRARQLSPAELVESCLQRIRRHDGTLHAFVTVTADLARREARRAEAEILAGRWRGPLHGIPYAAKDLFDTAGVRTTWGAAPLRDRVPDADATVVRRLREAGAVLIGKTAMIEFAGGLGYRFADASLGGATRTPWDTDRWAGGSSSGSGAAVAAGLCGFALGTETWGSILCPAAFNGVTGLRPTYGRVSRHGAMVCSWSFDKVGPLARSAEDCRFVLRAIGGKDPLDPTTADEPLVLEGPARRRPPQVRAALVPLDFSKHGEAESKRAFDAAVAELRAMGVRVEEAALPAFPAAEVAGVLITAEALSSFERHYRSGAVRELSDPYAEHQPAIHAAVTGADLVKAWRVRRALQQAMAEFFERFDVIVTPNFMSVAPPVAQDLFEALPYPDPVGAIGNACGLPALALPAGAGRGGLPVGFQLVGPPFSEALLLDLGEAYQKRTAHHRARPLMR